jgi:hypothetical protein
VGASGVCGQPELEGMSGVSKTLSQKQARYGDILSNPRCSGDRGRRITVQVHCRQKQETLSVK